MELINKLLKEGIIKRGCLYEQPKQILAFDDSIDDEDFKIVVQYAAANGLELYNLNALTYFEREKKNKRCWAIKRKIKREMQN